MLPRLPFIVLDQNAFRKPALLTPAIELARRTNAKVLIQDAALIEMMKNKHWEDTVRRSLAGLVACPELVVLGRGVSDLMRLERDTGRPAHTELEDLERTPSVRAMLAELASGFDGAVMTNIRAKIVATQTTIVDPQYMDHAGNKQQVVGFRDAWASELADKEASKKVRRDASFRAQVLAAPRVSRPVERELLSVGVSADAARRLAFERSVTAHSLLAMSALALDWFARGGLDSAPAESVTNDLMDCEYVTIGSFCMDVVTEDSKVKRLLSQLQEAAEIRSASASSIYA